MKKCLFFIPSMNSGGAEHVIANLSNSWSEQCDISILIFHSTPSFYPLNKKIKLIHMNLALPQKGWKRLLLFPWIEWKRMKFFVNYVKKNQFDCIFAFTETSSFIAMVANILYGISPIIVSERNDPSSYPIWLQKLILLLYHHAQGIICQNEYVKNYYLTHGFEIPLVVLPNPVNFQDIPLNNAIVKRREIVTVGRLTEQKNQMLLIHAFSEIASQYPEYILKIYGSGSLEQTLRTLIANLKMEKRIFLMGTKERVMFEVQQSDIFVLSSDFEGFPNVLIEAMASGMPVISSDFPTGVARLLIKDGQNGYLFPIGNMNALVTALKKMLACKDKWGKMQKINQQIARQYKVECVAEQWWKAIIKILNSSLNNSK